MACPISLCICSTSSHLQCCEFSCLKCSRLSAHNVSPYHRFNLQHPARKCITAAFQESHLALQCPFFPHSTVKAGRVPVLTQAHVQLTRALAVSKLAQHDAAAVSCVYDRWLQLRKVSQGPLLQHLWFLQPWKVRKLLILDVVCGCGTFLLSHSCREQQVVSHCHQIGWCSLLVSHGHGLA